MDRKQLLTSREYWIGIISVTLWNIHGCVEKDSPKYDKMAKKIVNDDFMSRIYELAEPKDLIESFKTNKDEE